MGDLYDREWYIQDGNGKRHYKWPKIFGFLAAAIVVFTFLYGALEFVAGKFF